jgi:hypothetical protein
MDRGDPEICLADSRQVEILKSGVAVWNSWRRGSPEVRPDLSEVEVPDANLARVDFANSVLRESNLAGVDLSGADLSGADLSGADLYEANLRAANLLRTDLSGTNLAGADLQEANLRGALLDRTHLQEARWTKTRLAFTVLADVDLSRVVGLEEVEHLAPSRIGTDTLFRSSGKIPRLFLVKAGLPQALVDALPDLVGSSGRDTYSCFVSYSSKDRAFAQRLYGALEEREIRHRWIDIERLLPGQKIADALYDAIQRSDKVVLCCSRSSLRSRWVRFEIDQALTVERNRHAGRGQSVPVLIPLDLDGHLTRWRDPRRATELRDRCAANFVGWERDFDAFGSELDRLARALRVSS